MKPSRNDPCPCGSGKKYKHCCLAKQVSAAESPIELQWRRLRRLLDGHPEHMLRFVQSTYGRTAIDEAWQAFMLWEEEAFNPDQRHLQVFLPWFFHCWLPDPTDTEVRDQALHEVPPTQLYLARKAHSLDPVLQRYLEACMSTPFSFHEVLRCDPGQGMRLRDILTGEEHEVIERSASQSIQRGDMLFGQVVETDGLALLEACSGFSIPPVHKAAVVALRGQISPDGEPISNDILRDFDFELIELYQELFDRLFNRGLPELQNTDGDPLCFSKLLFDIDSPQEAFDALKHLGLDASEEELLSEAERDAEGELARARFRWLKRGNAKHPGWENTVLGTIEIDRDRLTAEVN